MALSIDLNSDLGESFGCYQLSDDGKIIDRITSCNIACGFHASDPVVMDKTVSLALKANINIGAHPGFPDLMGFGRRHMDISLDEARAYVTYQIAALDGFCISKGTNISHVKPHGALYNAAAVDYGLAKAICLAIKDYNPSLLVFGLSGGFLVKAAEDLGLKAVSEIFADRAYEDDGTLASRKKEGSMITDENIAIERVIRIIKEGKVRSINGKDIDIKGETVCVHGDGEKALLFVTRIREELTKEGIEIKAPV